MLTTFKRLGLFMLTTLALAALFSGSVRSGEESKIDQAGGPNASHDALGVKKKLYRVAKTADFQVDGGGNAAWNKAEWADLDPRGPDRRAARFKMLYSDRGLYVLMEAEDRKLTASKDKADFDNLWTEDVLEFFLWPDERWPVYFEYEISPWARELALLVPNFGGRDKQHGWRPWHYEGERRIQKAVAVRREGPGGEANVVGWTAEVFVPYETLKPLQNVPPKPGARWRANVYRCDYDDGQPAAWSWSLTGSSFHEYEKFGTLVFE